MKRVGTFVGSLLDLGARGGRSSLERELRERVQSRLGSKSPAYAANGASLREDAGRLGAFPSALDRMHRVLSGDGVTVTAGQQPALLGGPLYSLYKSLGAIALARWIEDTLEVPALAVFWSVGDDSDFGEISSTWIPTLGGKPRKLRDADVPETGSMIGLLSVDRHRAALEDARSELAALPGSREVLSWLEGALEVSDTYGEFQCALLYRMLASDHFLCLDGGDAPWLAPATEWLRTAGRDWPLEEWLKRGAEDARALGMDPSFEPAQGRQALFALSGTRREAAQGNEDRLAPNVILRPLLQDWLLPNVATIGGPAEVRYRVQLTPVYEGGKVPEPLRLPRWQGVLLPAELGEPEGETPDYAAIIEDPASWVDSRAAAFLPARLRDAVSESRQRVADTLNGLRSELEAFDGSLLQLLDSTAQKTDFQIGRLLEGLEGKARHHAAQAIPGLAGLPEFLRPRQKPQERVLSLLTPFLIDGEDARAHLSEAAEDAWRHMLETNGQCTVTQWLRFETTRRSE